MKLLIKKDFLFSFDHINPTAFTEGQEYETTNQRFIEVVLEAKLAEEIKKPEKPGPSENKSLYDAPIETKEIEPVAVEKPKPKPKPKAKKKKKK